MSATHDTMLAAVAAMERAMQDLATAYRAYSTALPEAARAAYGETDRFRASEAAGRMQIEGTLVARMRALGLEAVLAEGRTVSEASEDWVSKLQADIRRLAS